MIDRLPLDLFDEETTEDAEGAVVRLALCQWCGVEHAADDVTCPDCGATLLRESSDPEPEVAATASAAVSELTECPWCNQPVGPDDETCRNCYAALRGDPNLVLPGVNVPLAASVLAAQVMAESYDEQGGEVAEAVAFLLSLAGDVGLVGDATEAAAGPLSVVWDLISLLGDL